MHWKEYYYLCMMRLLFCLLFISSFFFCKAQINNLVANPSFEEYSGCPNNTAQIDSCINWFQPLQFSSTEYFNACCSIPASMGGVGVPSNQKGFQYARTGEAYAGFGSYANGLYKEYLEGILIQELEANKSYCAELFYSIPASFYSSFFPLTLGFYFSTDSILSTTSITIPVTPQVVENTINDTVKWMKINGSFTAGGGEKYLLIGNFEGFLQQDGGIYTYIDDVSVYLCDDTLPKPQELKIPNVFTPDNDGANDLFFIENLPENSSIVIYNRWGQSILDKNNYVNNWDAHDVSAGIYYFVLSLPNGEKRKGFVQVIK